MQLDRRNPRQTLVPIGYFAAETELPIRVQQKSRIMIQNPSETAEMRLYTYDNRRLYLNETERIAFMATAMHAPALVRVFCLTLAYTGCRLSEARYLRKDDIQAAELLVSIETLKKRRRGQIREVPIPTSLMEDLARVHIGGHSLNDPYLFSDGDKPQPRIACYRWVKAVMAQAGIVGAQACPKGLRHGYGVHAIKQGVQLHMLQKWMGHASMTTTAIYATALGPEEQEIARRMW
jgi:integrase